MKNCQVDTHSDAGKPQVMQVFPGFFDARIDAPLEKKKKKEKKQKKEKENN